VGNAQGRLEPSGKNTIIDKPWRDAREGFQVKLLAETANLVFAQSGRSRRQGTRHARRQLKWVVEERAPPTRGHEASREELLMKLGAAPRSKRRQPWRLVDVESTIAIRQRSKTSSRSRHCAA